MTPAALEDLFNRRLVDPDWADIRDHVHMQEAELKRRDVELHVFWRVLDRIGGGMEVDPAGCARKALEEVRRARVK